jgi:hypothetical protein
MAFDPAARWDCDSVHGVYPNGVSKVPEVS